MNMKISLPLLVLVHSFATLQEEDSTFFCYTVFPFKTFFGPDLGPLGQNLDRHFFFNLASSFIRFHGQMLSCIISEKINDPIVRKFNDGQTDGQTAGQTGGKTDESDFIGCCSTNAENPTRATQSMGKHISI